MAWMPWANLPARSSMTTQELVDWLRAHAIEFNAPPQFIDAIDAIETEEPKDESVELREANDQLAMKNVRLKRRLAQRNATIRLLKMKLEDLRTMLGSE